MLFWTPSFSPIKVRPILICGHNLNLDSFPLFYVHIISNTTILVCVFTCCFCSLIGPVCHLSLILSLSVFPCALVSLCMHRLQAPHSLLGRFSFCGLFDTLLMWNSRFLVLSCSLKLTNLFCVNGQRKFHFICFLLSPISYLSLMFSLSSFSKVVSLSRFAYLISCFISSLAHHTVSWFTL